MSTSQTPADRPVPQVRERARRGRRRVARSGQPARDLRMVTKVSAEAWSCLDARAERAGLALGAWIGLLAEDVALGRPGVSTST